MNFYFKDTKKHIILSEKDEEHYKNNNICRFCEQIIESDKVRDHCQLTGKYRGPAHSKCKIIVTQKRSIFIPIEFHNLSNYECHLFFKELVDKKIDKVKVKVILETKT